MTTTETSHHEQIKKVIEHSPVCAQAHARSGEPAKISGYLGKTDVFDQAIADISIAYADQSERDHQVLTQAVREGRVEVFVEEP